MDPFLTDPLRELKVRAYSQSLVEMMDYKIIYCELFIHLYPGVIFLGNLATWIAFWESA